MQIEEGSDINLNSERSEISIAEPSTSSAAATLPGCYMIVHNVSKRHNIGTLVRSAAAFGVTEVSCLHPSTPPRTAISWIALCLPPQWVSFGGVHHLHCMAEPC